MYALKVVGVGGCGEEDEGWVARYKLVWMLEGSTRSIVTGTVFCQPSVSELPSGVEEGCR
jgi:hypothetical protein